MDPRPMYCMRDTASLISWPEDSWPRVNSARTLVEYCSSPTRVPPGDTSRASTMPITNCFTSWKLAGPRLFEPSITKTKSSGPSLHSISAESQSQRTRVGFTDTSKYHVSTVSRFSPKLVYGIPSLLLYLRYSSNLSLALAITAILHLSACVAT